MKTVLCCAVHLFSYITTTIIPGNVLPHNWMSKLDLKSGFYYIPINFQSHKCCSMLFGQCCQCLTRHSMGHQLAASIIFQTVVCLFSQHFNVSMVACLHCWWIFGPTILVHDILLFLQQLSLLHWPWSTLGFTWIPGKAKWDPRLAATSSGSTIFSLFLGQPKWTCIW